MKKLLAMVLTVIFTVSMMEVATAVSKFKDVKDTDWYAENVSVLVEKGIIGGYPDGTFGPNNNIKADEFIKTMVVALGYTMENGTAYWASTYIDKAKSLGIVVEGEFSVYTKAITRGEMARMVVRTVEMLEGSKTYEYGSTDSSIVYKAIMDKKDITANLRDFICKSYELGIIAGYPNGQFMPGAFLKRGEAVTVIRRVIEVGVRVPFVTQVSEVDKGFLEKYGYTSFTGAEGVRVDPTTDTGFATGAGLSLTNYQSKFELHINPYNGNKEIQYYEAVIIMTTVLKISETDSDKIIQMTDNAWNTMTPFKKLWFKTTDGKDFYVESGLSGTAPGGSIVSNLVY